MADSNDSTGAPLSRRDVLAGGTAVAAAGGGGGVSGSEGMDLLDAMAPALGMPDSDPRYDAAEAVHEAARRRLYRLRPACLGDAVAKLLAVTVAGNERMAPDDVGMIAETVAFLTRDAPGLRRPEVVRHAMDGARAMYPGG